MALQDEIEQGKAVLAEAVKPDRAYKSAGDAMAKRKVNVERLLKQIEGQVKDHAIKFVRSGGSDWGYAGSLGHVEQQLQSLSNFLSGKGD